MYCKLRKKMRYSESHRPAKDRTFPSPDRIKVLSIIIKPQATEKRYMLEANWNSCASPHQVGTIEYLDRDSITYSSDKSHSLNAFWVNESEIEVIRDVKNNRDGASLLNLSLEY